MTRCALFSVVAALSLTLALSAAPQNPSLPSFAELDALEFHPSTATLSAGAPDAAFLSAALNALWSFRSSLRR